MLVASSLDALLHSAEGDGVAFCDGVWEEGPLMSDYHIHEQV